ncbi:hypothetical protein [Leptospira santarosai]|uniref:hypothetical protein n=1 Tax=Leptospira santarosai TaxID=28183 RepID=UPI0002E7DB64|nr:hypothetical protein [Leptospira santarosai]
MNTLIDWDLCNRLNRSLKRRTHELYLNNIRDGIKLAQNKIYDPVLSILFMKKKSYKNLKFSVEEYLCILNNLIINYFKDQKIQDYFSFSEIEKQLILSLSDARIDICRFDGYISSKDGSLKILEHNADSPAGTFFTSIINDAYRKYIPDQLGTTLNIEDLPIDSKFCFINALLHAYSLRGKVKRPNFLILQVNGKSNKESNELASYLNLNGYVSWVADPSELEFNDQVSYKGNIVDLIWNKINIDMWRMEFQNEPPWITKLIEAIRKGKVCHVNPFSARYIVENKLSLSILHEEFYQKYLNQEEKSIINSLLPWAAKFEKKKIVNYSGKWEEMEKLVKDNQNLWVVKRHYDIRGEGVFIGQFLSKMEWDDIVKEAFENGYLLQEYIKPLVFPTLKDNSIVERELNFSLDCFMFNGKLQGFGSKVSAHHKVNIFQGGAKMAVLVRGENDS